MRRNACEPPPCDFLMSPNSSHRVNRHLAPRIRRGGGMSLVGPPSPCAPPSLACCCSAAEPVCSSAEPIDEVLTKVVAWITTKSHLRDVPCPVLFAHIQTKPSEPRTIGGGELTESLLHCPYDAIQNRPDLHGPRLFDSASLEFTNPVVKAIRERTDFFRPNCRRQRCLAQRIS